MAADLVYHFDNRNKAPEICGNHLHTTWKDAELAREKC